MVNATAIWRVGPSGSNTNGGGYDSGISGAGTDYSQQNSAQASGTHGACTTSTFTDSTAAAFTSVMVGNAMYITGGGSTAGWYFVITYSSASTVVLDRSPGGSVSGATWHLGGRWADFWTNTTSSGPLVPGNTVYILGSGIPNSSSYSYDYTPSTYFIPAAGNYTTGWITFAGDPNTPNYSTGGKPCIRVGPSRGIMFYQPAYVKVVGLWLVADVQDNGLISQYGAPLNVVNCVADQFGYDSPLLDNGQGFVMGNEFFSSKTAGLGSSYGIENWAQGSGDGGEIAFNNIHDLVSHGLNVGNYYRLGCHHNIIAKCGGIGIWISGNSSANNLAAVFNNTIDGNKGNGVEFDSQYALALTAFYNNIISNHTGSGKYGLTVDAGTAAENAFAAGFFDYNTYYGNTTNFNAMTAGPHDTFPGSSPYVAQSTENYNLA